MANYSSTSLFICLWCEWISRCSAMDGAGKSNGCMGPSLVSTTSMFTIAVTAVGKFSQVLAFVTETSSVQLLFRAVLQTLPTLGPHLGLFLAIYYGFAGMGMAFFCGLCKQSVLEGGPGWWGQSTAQRLLGDNTPSNYTMQNTKAFEVTWDSTMYGGDTYYYNLNYDSFPRAIASLYVVMIQNNWNVAADGPIQVTNGNFRWFFVGFTVMVAWVMINVLVGAIIDSLSAVRDQITLEESGDMDPLRKMLIGRLDSTLTPSGDSYAIKWEVGEVDLHGEVKYDCALTSTFAEEDGETETQDMLDGKLERKKALEAELARLKGQNPNIELPPKTRK
jgi:hypothetical protein